MKAAFFSFSGHKASARATLLAAVFVLPVLAMPAAVRAQDAVPASPADAAPATDSASSPASPGETPADPGTTPSGSPPTDSMGMGEARFPSSPGTGTVAPLDEYDSSVDPLQDRWMQMSVEEAFSNMAKVRPPTVTPDELDSLFFTTWQYELLKEAKRGFLSRPATVGEMEVDPGKVEERVRGPREVSLGGIVFVSANNWTIWLNGQRITPDALPTQVIDLQVEREFVQIKWFDSYNNLIYPLRLRPHQRFNLDSRIFLPGAGAETL